MRVTVESILTKINDLPADFRDHVQIDPEDKSLAYVRSFTTEDVYTVHIKPHVDDPGDKSILNTTCPCDARVLCRHVTAFYAKTKGLGPQIDSGPEIGPIHVEEPSVRLRALTLAAIDAEVTAHETRVELLLEVERIVRRVG